MRAGLAAIGAGLPLRAADEDRIALPFGNGARALVR